MDIAKLRPVRQLICLYLWLWILEGALRKWVVPSLANPLLVIRDPVVTLIYIAAARARIIPNNIFMIFIIALAMISALSAPVQPQLNPFIFLYGLRTNYLHLPLIFIIPRAVDPPLLLKIGRVCLWLAVPMTILMVIQFRADPNSFWNVGAGGSENGQISSSLGKIRPPGTFSFITGPVCYFSLVASFLLLPFFSNHSYSKRLQIAGLIAILLAGAVSGSRSMLSTIATVGFSAVLFGSILFPRRGGRVVRFLVIAGVAVWSIGFLPVFSEGTIVTNSRIADASGSEGGIMGFIARGLEAFQIRTDLLQTASIAGQGLGMGTNAAAGILTGERNFLLAEGEWDRLVLESGLIGIAFILFRITLMVWIGLIAIRHARHGNPLPLLLFAACGTFVLSGQFGQPTTQGFTALASGLCLAAGNLTNWSPQHALLRQ